MNENPPERDTEDEEKWDFADYAYTITGIIVAILLAGPEILETVLDISVLGGSLSNIAPALAESLEYGIAHDGWNISQLRSFSPLLFLLTTSIVYFQEAFEVRRTGEYKGSMFTHTFESLFEEAVYFTITTIMLYGAILFGVMYISWLAGPITWILFIVIFPLVRQKDADDSKKDTPWLMLFIFMAGIIAEVLTGAWIAFPFSWLVICMFSFVSAVRKHDGSIDSVFNILYYAFSVILMAVGVFLGSWIASWSAIFLALFICWVLHRFGKFKKEA